MNKKIFIKLTICDKNSPSNFWISPLGDKADGNLELEAIIKNDNFNFNFSNSYGGHSSKITSILIELFGRDFVINNSNKIKFEVFEIRDDNKLNFNNLYLFMYKIIFKDGSIYSLSRTKNEFIKVEKNQNTYLNINSDYSWFDDDLEKKYNCKITDLRYIIFDKFIKENNININDIEDMSYISHNLEYSMQYAKNINVYDNFISAFKFIEFKDFLKEQTKKINECIKNDKDKDYTTCLHYYHKSFSFKKYDELSDFELFLINVYDYLVSINLASPPNNTTYTENYIYLMNHKDHFYNTFINNQIKEIIKIFKNKNFKFNLNELIRKYYKKEYNRKTYFTVFINYYVDNIIKPDINKNIDVIKKYGITSNNLSNILLEV